MTTSGKKQRGDGTGYRSSREQQFAEAWAEFNPFGPCGIPVHDFRFRDDRKWMLDFAWPEVRLAVEIQGFGGGHQSIAGLRRDAEKTREALLDGWIIVPVTSACLGSKAKVAEICQFVAELICLKGSGHFTVVPQPAAESLTDE